MDPKVVLVLTWATAGAVVGAYIWFVVWRYRAEQRKKVAQEESDTAMSDKIARTAERVAAKAGGVPPSGVGDAVTAPIATPPSAAPAARAPAPRPEAVALTVADAVSGITLPYELAPLTTMASRSAVGDRVAFWTDVAPAEVVGPAFADELERLGYSMSPLDERTISATRDGAELMVVIHPDGRGATVGGQVGFPSVPEFSVVIEVWIP
jgi:hypothetical protein